MLIASYLFHFFMRIKVNIILSQYVPTPMVPIIAIVTHCNTFCDLSKTA